MAVRKSQLTSIFDGERRRVAQQHRGERQERCAKENESRRKAQGATNQSLSVGQGGKTPTTSYVLKT
eukprot:scaffold148440_cov32-Tisochrysis_lutea.AAC.2